MWQPRVRGEIERRLLVNYRVDPEVLAQALPAPFRAQLVEGSAVAGICLIRLGAMRVAGAPRWAGLRSENAAHRMAVEWDDPKGVTRTGVYEMNRSETKTDVRRGSGSSRVPRRARRTRLA
jgi:hypothetical protein